MTHCHLAPFGSCHSAVTPIFPPHLTTCTLQQFQIRYTLFLKDIGVSLEDAISFWEHYYSQPAKTDADGPRWRRDGRRYVYSVRHLYGLEGARRNYASHSCTSIQVLVHVHDKGQSNVTR